MNKLKEKIIFIPVFFLLIVIAVTAYYSNFYDLLFGRTQDTFDYLKILDVGNADCYLIHSDGKYVLIDAGSGADDGNAIEKKLRSLGIDTIDYLILSHGNSSHIGGAVSVLKNFKVNTLLCAKDTFSNGKSVSTDVLKITENRNTEILTVSPGEYLSVGSANIEFLWFCESEIARHRCFLINVDINDRDFLFAADVLFSHEIDMLSKNIDVDCDVFISACQGDSNSNSVGLLDAAMPQICVVSLSEDKNLSKIFTNRVNERNIRLFTTSEYGDITFDIDGNRIFTQK